VISPTRRCSHGLRRAAPLAAEAELQLLPQAVDALTTGIVLYDAQDGFVLCSTEVRRLCEPMAHHLVPGRRFEDPMRLAIADGLVPTARGQKQAWLAARVLEHQDPLHTMARQMANRRRLEHALSKSAAAPSATASRCRVRCSTLIASRPSTICSATRRATAACAT
jgi:hypothetical protein